MGIRVVQVQVALPEGKYPGLEPCLEKFFLAADPPRRTPGGRYPEEPENEEAWDRLMSGLEAQLGSGVSIELEPEGVAPEFWDSPPQPSGSVAQEIPDFYRVAEEQ